MGRRPALGRVTGTVSYLERIAPPRGATVRVWLEDTSAAGAAARPVAQSTLDPGGRVPVAFALDFDAAAIDPKRAYGVRAQIKSDDGRLLWTSTAAQPVLTRGHPSEAAILVRRVPTPVAPPAGLAFYECDDGLTFGVRTGGSSVQVLLADRTLVLPQVPSGSGAKYTDGADLFWSKGNDALLEAGDRAHHGCRSKPAGAVWEEARLRGVDFRATGNEPGWYLELRHGGEMLLVTGYGEQRLVTATPPPSVVGTGATAYRARADTHDLVVTIHDAPCADDMSGESFPSRVLVQLDDEELRGCGRRLR